MNERDQLASLLRWPFDCKALARKRPALRRALLERPGLLERRIAVLGGSTTSDIVKTLELFLRNRGIVPAFYESEYAQYWEDAMFPNPVLEAFRPELIFIHTTSRNIRDFPAVTDSR
jgi:predicted enzyme involved in methoxymalonyl-ACP biosynthesis